jgi:hypothetical protein
LGHDKGPGLREQDAEHDTLTGTYPGQFLSCCVAAGEPVPCGRDEMLGDPDLIVILCYPACVTVCGLAAATRHSLPPVVLVHRPVHRPVKRHTTLSC